MMTQAGVEGSQGASMWKKGKKKVLTSKWAARTENNKSVWVETQKRKKRKSPAAEVKGLRFGYFRHHIMGFLFFFRPHLNRWDLARWAPISHDEISHGCDPHRCCFFLHLFDFSSDRVKEKKRKGHFSATPPPLPPPPPQPSRTPSQRGS